ncbi:MAG: phosphonate ABC transporter substrate-binding protein [Planctomycetota bacterium]|nr:phosphonate ABC transporter substrate-binding protein [Planctomycetota bacterium]MCX8039507.1 phosphonate ABC transporter substrate-binding protein [Planctomycetota bacterium]MDW8373026.1 phosphonate ABC transporter substrate-binding protein [Planctomycetota bacterium]
MRLRFLALLIACVAALSAQEMPKELSFGVISTESTVNLKPSWEPLFADLSAALGIPVKGFFANDYNGIIEGMRFKKVDIAWHGNKSAMLAVDRADGEVFARVVNIDGSEGYYSYVIVHKDSPYQTIDELLAKGKEVTFGLGDPNSTSGTLVPGFYIFAQRGIDPKAHFKRVTNAKHEANILAVVARQVDAATCASDAYARLGDREPDKIAQTRIVWKSPLIPSDPIVWRKDLPAALKDKIRAFFLNYGNTEAGKKVLPALKWSGFRASDNSQLIPIRQLELAKQKAEIENDGKMSADEKQKALAEIDAKLAALAQQR